MRVIEPRSRSGVSPGRKKRSKLILFLATLILLSAPTGVYLYMDNQDQEQQNNSAENSQQDPVVLPKKQGVLKTFSGQGFVDFYYTLAFPNTQQISEEAPITGNEKADNHIKQLAKARGYRIQSAPVADVLVDVGNNMLLQPRAANNWKSLKSVAAKDGIELSLTAGFRPADEQKTIFLNRLKINGSELEEVPRGVFDSRINQVLITTALPGYSKHHTGYTIDISCPSDPNVVFEGSVCFSWLSKNNYKNAKNSGWIPSYPEGAKKQGPNPEAWEYVWVGKDSLTK